jgi:hypothetical protein
MEAVTDRPKPLFSKTIRPGGRVYYLDLYPPRNGGSPCLSVCELRKDKEGKQVKFRMYLYPEAVVEMRNSLDEVNDFLESYTPAKAGVGEDE